METPQSEFDTFLDSITTQGEQEETEELLKLEIDQDIIRPLAYELDLHLMHAVDKAELETSKQYYVRQILRQFTESEEGFDPDDVERNKEFFAAGAVELNKQHDLQRNIIAGVRRGNIEYLEATQGGGTPTDMTKFDTFKLRRQVYLLMRDDMEIDQRWITFLDKALPGKLLSEQDPADVAEMMESTRVRLEKDAYDKTVHAELLTIITHAQLYDDDYVYDDGTHARDTVCTLMMQAGRHLKSQPAREARIDEFGRIYRVTPDVVSKVTTLLEERYPYEA